MRSSTRVAGQGLSLAFLALAVLAAVAFLGTQPLAAKTTATYLDPTFGSGGKVMFPLSFYGSYANSTVVQPDGKIVFAGATRTRCGSGCIGWTNSLTRLNADGTVDSSFHSLSGLELGGGD